MELTTDLLDPIINMLNIYPDEVRFSGDVCHHLIDTANGSCEICPLYTGTQCVRHTHEFFIFVKTHYPELFL